MPACMFGSTVKSRPGAPAERSRLIGRNSSLQFVYDGRTQGKAVQPQRSDVDSRFSELQTQIDGLNLALQQWRQIQEHSQPNEQRLAELTEQCAGILNRWTATDERHTEAIAQLEARLSDWGAIEKRLQHDSRERIRELEQTIEHEWQSLRRMHEEPVKQLREQAATLGETCVAAANLALRGFERAEARFAALEQDLQGRMNQLSRDLQAAIGELHSGAAQRPRSLPEGTSPFPLEGVMRIHDELRDSDEAGGRSPRLTHGGEGASQDSTPPAPQLTEAPAALNERLESLEQALGEAKITTERTEGLRQTSYVVVGALLFVVLVVGAFVVRAQRRADARLNEAITRAAEAERQSKTATDLATRQIANTREQAGRQVAEARQAANQAQVVGDVLAAPDLMRFNLTATDATSRASAQVLLSRGRGLVFSASRLPPAPAGSAYQLWLLTTNAPVSAGLVVPDQAGRVTLVAEVPPNLPRPVTGATVTLEPAGGRPSPSGATILAHARAPSPP
jgi:Anti-sigma-K factor rskA